MALDPRRREPSLPSSRIRERQDPAYNREAFLRDLERVAPPGRWSGRAPAVQRPDYRTEVASLRGMSTSAGQLADALQGGPSGAIRSLLLRFERAETLDQTVAAQKAQHAAIRAYDRQVARLTRLSAAAEQERLRLANDLN